MRSFSHQPGRGGLSGDTASSLSGPTRPFHASGPGNATGMPDGVLQRMQKSFSTDFSNVRIFPNSGMATQLSAHAFTQGHNIHFAPGKYNPGSSDGQKLISHELRHVVQQRGGRVKPTTRVKGLPVNDNPALEKEADGHQ